MLNSVSDNTRMYIVFMIVLIGIVIHNIQQEIQGRSISDVGVLNINSFLTIYKPSMESELVATASVFTVFFLAYSLLEVTGLLPQEMRSAGLALPSLFSRLYGQEVSTRLVMLCGCCVIRCTLYRSV